MATFLKPPTLENLMINRYTKCEKYVIFVVEDLYIYTFFYDL